MIKFWSYNKEYKKYKNSLLKKINITLTKGNIFFGDELKKFETNFIKKYKSKYGIAVGSGTDALLISLLALNLKKNDEVIAPANTAIPTISAIVNSGAKVKLIDICDDYLMNTNKLKNIINKKTKVIIPVHLYGQPCNMDEIQKIEKKYKIHIIEDCAQSQGARFKNKYVGTFGLAGCFSFYPTKILGTYGDGGFILTNDFEFFKKIKRIRFYGIESTDKKNKFFNKYYAFENGINSRIDEIQSTILNFKLGKVDKYIKKRKKLAQIYIKELEETSLVLPRQNKKCQHVYNLFTVCHPKKKLIQKYLIKKNIQTRIIYPYPIHLMKAYKKYAQNKKLINVEKKTKNIFCLPLYPELNKDNVIQICKQIKICLNKHKI